MNAVREPHLLVSRATRDRMVAWQDSHQAVSPLMFDVYINNVLNEAMVRLELQCEGHSCEHCPGVNGCRLREG